MEQYTKESINSNIMLSYLIHNLIHEDIIYNLDWIGYEWQALTIQLNKEEEMYEHHSKQRILDSMSDQDIWQIMKDKKREHSESAEKCAKFFERELNHRKNPERFEKEDLSALKERVDILDVVEHFCWNVRYRPWWLIKCPFPDHNDWTASFSINTKKNYVKCFGCNKWWSSIDFIMHMTWCSLPEAINKLKSFI